MHPPAMHPPDTRHHGPQDLHKQLERKISAFHGTADTILYPSCFDANAGLFEGILTAEDVVISDQLNHASIIDGIRLCKAKRYRSASPAARPPGFVHRGVVGSFDSRQNSAGTSILTWRTWRAS